MSDREEISALLCAYCRLLDDMDLAALGELFTEDCLVEYGPDEALKAKGRAALVASLARLWRWQRTSHHLSNVEICFAGPDAAVSTSYVLAWHERPDGSTATVMGQYRDRHRRTGEGWRIAERRMVMTGSDAGFSVDLFRLDRRPPPQGWVAPMGLDGGKVKRVGRS